MTLDNTTPVLAHDMCKHTYATDYGAKAGAYVDALMAAANWSSAGCRFAHTTASDGM